MRLRVAAYPFEAEVVRPPAIEGGDQAAHVVTVLVDRAQRHVRAARGVEMEPRAGRRGETFMRIDLDVGWMIDGKQAYAIEEHRFLELVRDPDLVAAIARDEAIAGNANVLVGVGRVELARPDPVAHLPPAE